MPRRELSLYRWEIVDSAETIVALMRGRTSEEYVNDRTIRGSVEREFITIGEALSQALKMKPDLAIRAAPQVIAFRNILVHGYYDIDHMEVWRTIHDDLPLLISEVRALLGPSSA